MADADYRADHRATLLGGAGAGEAGSMDPTTAPRTAMSSTATGMIQFSLPSPSKKKAVTGRLKIPRNRRMRTAVHL